MIDTRIGASSGLWRKNQDRIGKQISEQFQSRVVTAIVGPNAIEVSDHNPADTRSWRIACAKFVQPTAGDTVLTVPIGGRETAIQILRSSASGPSLGDAIGVIPVAGRIRRAFGDDSATADSADVLNVRDFGAVGAGSGVTVAGVGEDIAAIRTETGQAWLEDTDSMDLVAAYRARVVAEQTGRTIFFPRDRYVFTAPFFQTGVAIDGDGSTIVSTAADATRFVRSNRVFILGILAREDFARFDTEGWSATADSIARGARTITNYTGAAAIGATIMIRTTAAVGTLPTYTTWNKVIDVAGTTLTLQWPVEKAITSPKIVNYSTIATLKSTLAPGPPMGEPHRYYCATGASLRNVTLEATDGAALEVNAALDFDIDIRIHAPKGQAAYGNSWSRGRVRIAGTFGGPKAPIELAVGSALTSLEVDLRYSGLDTDSSGAVSGDYNIVQFSENIEYCHVAGRINAGNKPSNLGVTFPTASNCRCDAKVIGLAVTNYMIAFPSNAGTGNRVSGEYEISTVSTHYAYWNAGTGSDNWLEDAIFKGDQSGTVAFRFLGPNLGGILGGKAPEGMLQFDAGATGNPVVGCHIREGLSSAGPPDASTVPQITTANGPYPESSRVVTVSATSTLLAREVWQRRIVIDTAGALRTITAPAAIPGMAWRALRSGANLARIDPNGTETIGAGGAGKYLELQVNGGSVVLACYVAGKWVIEASSHAAAYEP